MMKIILITILAIQVFGGVEANDIDDLYQVIDAIISPLIPIGNPETPLVEDVEKIKKICALINIDFMNKQKDKVAKYLTGILYKMLQHSLDHFTTDKVLICKLAKEGGEKASLMAKEYNRHAVEANKLRLSYLTALHELKDKGTKASLPTLSCYAKQFAEKLIAVYPEKDGAKEMIKSGVSHVFNDIIVKTLESESIKAVDSCPMPLATTNPSKFNSVLIATYVTIQTLQDKQ